MAFTKEMAEQNKAIYQDALQAIADKVLVIVFDEDEGVWSKQTQVQRKKLADNLAKKHGLPLARVQTQIGNAIRKSQSKKRR